MVFVSAKAGPPNIGDPPSKFTVQYFDEEGNMTIRSRFKRMKQLGRLQSAKGWLSTYKGKNILQGYRKQYGVDLLCAIRELEMLGVVLNSEYVKAVKQSIEGGLLAKKRKKIKEQEAHEGVYGVDYDEYFSFIAGHTEGGASYGVPWES